MTETADLIAVREAHRFDEARLATYLREHLPGCQGALTVRQFQGGQSNPTFLIEAGGRRWVLRKKPPGKLLPSAHMVEREYRVIRALADSSVPVPGARLLCEDAGVIGTPFYVMDHVEGRVFTDPTLPGLTPAARSGIYAAMAETLARLHAVDWRAAGLADYGRPENYVARQIARWSKQYEASKTGEIPAMDRLTEWLPRHIPAREETTLAHGDYRLGNLIFHPSEPRVVAVLDWELSTLGHPLADLGYNCMLYHLPADLPTVRGFGDTDLAALGIPDERQYVAIYARHTGRDPAGDWPFFLAFSLFRYAAIVQGVYARALQGNASSASGEQLGRAAPILAEIGWRIAERGA
ncbi:MAG TPA: phosphotransferase [Alphaproteobacteria bacterium]|nr:phosphotransferase [Alphaproteobacteria bacterium]